MKKIMVILITILLFSIGLIRYNSSNNDINQNTIVLVNKDTVNNDGSDETIINEIYNHLIKILPNQKLSDYGLDESSDSMTNVNIIDHINHLVNDNATNDWDIVGYDNSKFNQENMGVSAKNITAPRWPKLFKEGDKVQFTMTYGSVQKTFDFKIWTYNNTPWDIAGVVIPVITVIITAISLTTIFYVKKYKKNKSDN